MSREKYQSPFKEEKWKNSNIGVKDIKISLKTKNEN